MIRRTSWRHYHHDHLEIAARTARWMATSLNWDESAIQTELIRYQQLTGTNARGCAYVSTLPFAGLNVS